MSDALHAPLVGGILVGAVLALALKSRVALLFLPLLALAPPLLAVGALLLLGLPLFRLALLAFLLQLLLRRRQDSSQTCHFTCACC